MLHVVFTLALALIAAVFVGCQSSSRQPVQPVTSAQSLSFSVQPVGARAGLPLSAQPNVKLLDSNGMVSQSATNNVMLSAYVDAACTTAAPGSVYGLQMNVSASQGVASFKGITYSSPGIIYFKATSDGLKSICSSAVSLQPRLKNFAIYYAYPSITNYPTLAYSLTAVVNFYKQYSVVVFGTGLADPAHPDFTNTVSIAAGLRGKTEVFGYVALGNPPGDSINAIKAKIDQWANNVAVAGIFVDIAGFDFWNDDATMRQRQNAIFDYIHSKNLKIFVNAFDPDDLFTKLPSAPTTLHAGDYYLYESYVFSSGTRESLTAHMSKVAKLNSAQATKGIEVFVVNTTSALSGAYVQSDFDYITLSAVAEGFDAVSWGTVNYSASGSDNGIMPYRAISISLSSYLFNSPLTTAGQFENRGSVQGAIQLNYGASTFSAP